MKQNYEYPLNFEWSKEEMVQVISMWNEVEKAYETGVQVSSLLETYDAFKKVVSSIGEEKKLGRQFEECSNYSLYKTIKVAKEKQKGLLKMGSDNKCKF